MFILDTHRLPTMSSSWCLIEKTCQRHPFGSNHSDRSTVSIDYCGSLHPQFSAALLPFCQRVEHSSVWGHPVDTDASWGWKGHYVWKPESNWIKKRKWRAKPCIRWGSNDVTSCVKLLLPSPTYVAKPEQPGCKIMHSARRKGNTKCLFNDKWLVRRFVREGSEANERTRQRLHSKSRSHEEIA